MTRWFRFYDDAVNDPKVQRLPGEKFKAWVNLLCIASKNNGVLPSLPDVAFILRLGEDELSSLLDEFCAAGLLDPVEVLDAPMSYKPHNWDVRQYKSDVTDPTAPTRMKRYRYRKRNDRNATVTVTATRAETEADTEQKDSEANASGADAPCDPSVAEREFFQRGRQVLGKGAGGQLAKLKAAKGHNIALARAVIEMAATKDRPGEYVAAAIRGPPAKPMTVHQAKHIEGRQVLDELREFNTRASGRKDSGILRLDTGDVSEGIRGGAGGNLIELSPGSDRPRG